MKFTINVFLFMLIIMFFGESMYAQESYSKMRISFRDGTSVEGKKGTMGRENVTLMVGGTSQNYSLDEIDIIMARKGRIGKYAMGFGGGCLAIGLLTTVVNPNDDDVGTLLAGSFLWAGIFAGIGAGVGALSDPWTNIYVRRSQSSILKDLNLTFSSNRLAPYNIGLVYTINR